MRERKFIRETQPCDTDFTDKSIQSIADVVIKGPTLCPNYPQCEKRNVREQLFCYRQMAQQMANHIMDNGFSFSTAVREEIEGFLENAPDGKFWVFRDEKWQIVEGKENVVDDVVAFALVIIDRKSGERRPFTKDGMRTPEMGPKDAIHNAMLDLDDIYGEVGQKNPFRR